MKHIFVFFALIVLLITGNKVFNIIEKKLSQPVTFKFELKDGLLPDLHCKRWGVSRNAEIEGVFISGTFNSWSNDMDNFLEGNIGYPLIKESKNVWKIVLKLPPGENKYKYQIFLKDRNLREKIAEKGVPYGILWIEDMSNPKKTDDTFGGHNSVKTVYSVKPYQKIFDVILGLALLFLCSSFILGKIIHYILSAKILFHRKIIIVVFFIITAFAGGLAVYGLAKMREKINVQTNVMVSTIFAAARSDIASALNKMGLQSAFIKNKLDEFVVWFMPAQNPLVNKFHCFTIHQVEIYGQDGCPKLFGTQSHIWFRQQKAALEYFQKNRWRERDLSQIKQMTWGMEIPLNKGRMLKKLGFPDAPLDITIYPVNKSVFEKFSYWFRCFILTKKIWPYDIIIYPLSTARKCYGYIIIRISDAPIIGINSGIVYFLKWFAGAFLILLIAFLFPVSILAKTLLAPIYLITDGMKKIEKGDYSANVEIETKDEFQRMGGVFNDMVKGLKERELIKDTFGKYVTKQVADNILENLGRIDLEGEKKDVTVLFADIRQFTPYAENHLPEEVIKTLNEYFAMMIDVIFRNEGTLDKFIGDCIMVIFGAPLQMSDHPLRAVKTAIEMQSALEDFNQRRTSEGKEPISIGIGINSGEAIVGNVGSEKKVEFTVVGDSVNIASRLESNSKKGQILIGKNTYKRVKDYITAKKLGCIEMKGKTNQIEIYEVKGFTAGGGK